MNLIKTEKNRNSHYGGENMRNDKLVVYCDLYGHNIKNHDCLHCPVREPGISLAECSYRGEIVEATLY